MKVQAIIPAAGAGTRLGAQLPKALVAINGRAMIAYTLEVFQKSARVESIIVVAPKAQMPAFEKIIKKEKLGKVLRIIAGGATRRESIANGLMVLDKDTEVVLVHDAARALVTEEILHKALDAVSSCDAVVVAEPVKSTIKEVDPQSRTVRKTLERSLLWEIQTPQVFKSEVLRRAHEANKDFDATDDAALVELLGIPVAISEGQHSNFKITTREDLVLAQAVLESRNAKGK